MYCTTCQKNLKESETYTTPKLNGYDIFCGFCGGSIKETQPMKEELLQETA